MHSPSVPAPSTFPSTIPDAFVGDWTAIRATGSPQPLLAAPPVTLRITASTFGVATGCNYLWTASDRGLRIENGHLLAEFGSTTKACGPPLSTQEAWLERLLNGTPTIAVTDGWLRIGSGGVQLEAERT